MATGAGTAERAGQPELVRGPELAGQPERAAGQPERAAGQPERAAGQPEPERVWQPGGGPGWPGLVLAAAGEPR